MAALSPEAELAFYEYEVRTNFNVRKQEMQFQAAASKWTRKAEIPLLSRFERFGPTGNGALSALLPFMMSK